MTKDEILTRLFKEGSITIDELVILKGETVVTVYVPQYTPTNPIPWYIPPSPIGIPNIPHIPDQIWYEVDSVSH